MNVHSDILFLENFRFSSQPTITLTFISLRRSGRNISVSESSIGRTCDFIFRPVSGHGTSFKAVRTKK